MIKPNLNNRINLKKQNSKSDSNINQNKKSSQTERNVSTNLKLSQNNSKNYKSNPSDLDKIEQQVKSEVNKQKTPMNSPKISHKILPPIKTNQANNSSRKSINFSAIETGLL